MKFWRQCFHMTRHNTKLIFLSLSSETQEAQDEILKEIKKCAAGINTNIIDHTALIRGSAAKSNIDLEKYRDEVRREISDSKEKKGSYSDMHTFKAYSHLSRNWR